MEKNNKKNHVPYFTRKNLITIALVAIFSILLIFVGLCLSAKTTKIFASNNPILLFAKSMGFQEIQINGPIGFIGLALVSLYIIVFVCALIYEIRFAKINKIPLNHYKMWITYVVTFLICIGLSYGVTCLLLVFFKSDEIGLISQYLGQSLLISLICYVGLAIFVGSIVMLVTNFILIDKPYKAFKKTDEEIIDDIEEEKENDVTNNFDVNENEKKEASISSGNLSINSAPLQNNVIQQAEMLGDREKVFPGLYAIDVKYDGYPIEKEETGELNLEEICERFRNYLAKEEGLYFDIKVLRFFISGFAATRLSILEGLSGTGKSSLPRYFAKFINADVTFLPVQATWRDKTSILGYFNDFSKTYTETDFLLALYNANYNPDKINIFVLDEMNISRVEYYFADFLSILEYPSEQWKLKIMQLPYGFVPPAKLDNGYIQIPTNSFFIGTANKDDSTFSISDKVYDRANTIFFDNRNEPFSVSEDASSIKLSSSRLQYLYNEAISNKANGLNKTDLKKFYKITNYIYETFDVTFGNRILNQIEKIVPTYVSCGGKKEEAIDFILSRKLISKLDGRFEEYIKPSLKKLLDLLDDNYGKGTMMYSEKVINTLIKKL